MDNSSTIQSLKEKVDQFIEDRDWKQFHNPQELAVSLSIEVAEMLEIFQWRLKEDLTEEQLEKVKEELADILIYSISMANTLDLDISTIIADKIAKNAEKYPIEVAKGSNKKYTEHNNDSL